MLVIPTDLVPTDWDDDEPYVLDQLELGPADVISLAGVPVAANDCVFQGCDLSALSFHGVKNSRFASCKLRGARFTKHVTNSSFDECLLAECNFRLMAFKNVVFDATQLSRCDFYGSELAQVSFPKSSIEGVGFDACTLVDVDLSLARELLIGDPRTLTGTTIAEAHVHAIALRLAELTGINVQTP